MEFSVCYIRTLCNRKENLNTMIVNIPPKISDDPVFLTALNGMLANLVDAHRPSEGAR